MKAGEFGDGERADAAARDRQEGAVACHGRVLPGLTVQLPRYQLHHATEAVSARPEAG